MGSVPGVEICSCEPEDFETLARVLIVGAGFGGLGCAHALANSYDASSLAITLVDSKDYFTNPATWQFVWTGRAAPEQTKWQLAEAAPELPGVDIRTNTTLWSLDLQARRATLKDGSALDYDYLVLAPGVVSDGASIPGLAEAAVDLANIHHMERAKRELEDFIARAKATDGSRPLLLVAITAIPYKCPPMPFEVALLVDHELRAAGMRGSARVAISCSGLFPVGGSPPNPASEVLLPLLAERGIEWMPEHKLKDVRKSADMWRVSFDNGVELDADNVFAVFPQHAPDLFVSAGLTDPTGFIPVDLLTNRLKGKGDSGRNVFAIGDACSALIPKTGKPHPKAGEFAWQMGTAVAANIRASVCGAPDELPSIRGGHCIIEAGGDSVLDITVDLMKVMMNPAEGTLSVQLRPTSSRGMAHEKLHWINGYVKALYGNQSRYFSPASM